MARAAVTLGVGTRVQTLMLMTTTTTTTMIMMMMMMIASGRSIGDHMTRYFHDTCCQRQEIPASQSSGWIFCCPFLPSTLGVGGDRMV